MINEIWKPVKGFEGLYEISNTGNVKSAPGKNKGGGLERILKVFNNKIGYPMVMLYKHGEKKKCFKIHRLIAEHFIANPHNYTCINHIDSNKTNNSIDNLEWCTQSHNVQHSYDTGRRIGVWTGKKFDKDRCAAIKKRFLESNHKRRMCVHIYTGKVYESGVFACSDLGYDYNKVKQVIKNTKNKYGIVWISEYEKMFN